jgi:hypothetical protein
LTYCGSCGMPVAGDFCGSCGARRSQAGGPVVPPAAPQPSPTHPVTLTKPVTPVPPQEPAGAPVMSEPTVPLGLPEPEPVGYEPTPAAGSWSASPAAQPPPVRSALPPRRRVGWLVAATAAGVLLLATGGYAAAKATILKDGAAGSTSAPASGSAQPIPTSVPIRSATPSPASATGPVAVPVPLSPTPTPTPSAATPSADPAPAAYARLEALVGQDSTRPTVRGQWVAQLSSKSQGVVDTTLQPTPFTFPDILAEHLRLRENPGYGSLVRLVHLGDWGGIATPAAPMWVTVGDINARSSAEVTTWCQATFSQRGKALDNVCLARHLTLKSQ